MPPVDCRNRDAGFVEFEPLVLVGLDLVWVVVGILAVALLFGFWLILFLLNAILGKVSIFGFHPFGFAYTLINDAMKSALGLLDQKAGAFAEFLWGIVQTLWRFFYVATVTIWNLWWRDIAHHQDSLSKTVNEQNRALARENFIVGVLDGEVTRLNNEVNQTATDIRIKELEDVERLDFDQTLEAETRYGQDQQLQAEIDTRVAGVQARMQVQLNADVASLTQQMATQRNVLEGEITNTAAGLQNQIGLGVQAAQGFALQSITSASPGIVAKAVTALQPQLDKITTHEAECLDSLCDTVTPQAPRLGRLGNNLAGLEDLGIEALLIALAVEAAHDPAAVVRDVETVVQTVGSGAMTAYRDLIGL